jgi:hypothetical protein
MALEYLHGAHGGADLPSRDGAADQLGHAILDRVGVGAARGTIGGQRNRAAAAPGFGQITRKLLERRIHSGVFLPVVYSASGTSCSRA